MKRAGERNGLKGVLIYLALAAGALVFAWPFVWMAATSVKMESEMYRTPAHFWPLVPVEHAQSPYLDERSYREVTGPRAKEAEADIKKWLEETHAKSPAGLEESKVEEATAALIYKKLRNELPDEFWAQPEPQLGQALRGKLTPGMTGELWQAVRALGLGAVTAKARDAREDVLVSGTGAGVAWEVAGGHARLENKEPGRNSTVVEYDVTSEDRMELAHTFATSFPAAELHRVQISIQDDDSWNALTLVLEKDGHRYEGTASHALGGDGWTLVTWQEPGPDDQSTGRIHNWITLKEAGSGAQYVHDPHQMRLVLEVRRVSGIGAWWEKIRRNYEITLGYVPFWRYIATSTFLVILSLIGTLFSCSLVAYSFARLQWPGRNFSFALMLATMMVPAQVTMIPYFMIVRTVGWYNTLYPLWVGSFFAAAFNVFLLRQFMLGVPRDLEDAARIDGCGFWRIYWHIMLPLVRPTLAAIGIFTFMAAWNDFMGPLIYLSDQRLYPLSLGLYALSVSTQGASSGAGSFGVMMAGSLLMTLPVMVIFFFAQRYFLKGVTLTGMKA